MTLLDSIRFTDEQWAQRERDWTRWWEHDLGRPIVVIHEGAEPLEIPAADELPFYEFTSNYGLDTPEDRVLDAVERSLARTRWHGDAFPKWWINFGPGVLAVFLGCTVTCEPNTVWFSPPAGASDRIEDLRPRYDAGNVWWRRVQELTAAAVRRWGASVAVSHTDIGGNLDVIASFRDTQQLLIDLVDAPGEVDRLVGEVTRLWLRYYEGLDAIIRPKSAPGSGSRGTTPWAAIWSPKRCYMLQCDFCYMISPAHFERFVLPDLDACCDHLEHGFYHLDGRGALPHLDMLLSIKNLRGVQWIPGAGNPEPDQWMDVLRRIRDAGKLCQIGVHADGARRIVREMGGRGFVFQVWPPMNAEQAKDYLDLLRREDRYKW